MSPMSDAAYNRAQAERTQRLIDAIADQVTRERLSALVAEYLTKAQSLEAQAVANPFDTM
jgi:hypothetical protein